LTTYIAEMRGQDPEDALFDLLLEENQGIPTVGLGTNSHTLAFVSHPSGMIASDAILFGSTPIHVPPAASTSSCPGLCGPRRTSGYQKQSARWPLFRSSASACPTAGFSGTVPRRTLWCSTPTRSRPKQCPVRIEYVIVNGKVVIDQGENAGALPRRSLCQERTYA